MRIALVHSFYTAAHPSGETAVVLDQAAVLRAAGHDVHLVAAHTDTLARSRWYTPATAIRVATGRGGSPLEALEALRPDLVHVHNLFPNFGTSWLRSWPGPLVTTVHNYRYICAAATLTRNGRPCRECLTRGSAWPGLLHRCYRGSAPATLPLTLATRRPPDQHPLLSRADAIVLPSPSVVRTLRAAGLTRKGVHVVPHFVATLHPGEDSPTARRGDGRGGTGFAWVGRISPEKGLAALLRAWPDDLPLVVVGDGPDRGCCESFAPPSVRFIGTLGRTEVMRTLAGCAALVISSAAPETFGLTHAEAVTMGTPVVALAGSGIAEAVEAHGTGLVVQRIPELPGAALAASAAGTALRDHCRTVAGREYGPGTWADAMGALYARLVPAAARAGTAPGVATPREGERIV